MHAELLPAVRGLSDNCFAILLRACLVIGRVMPTGLREYLRQSTDDRAGTGTYDRLCTAGSAMP